MNLRTGLPPHPVKLHLVANAANAAGAANDATPKLGSDEALLAAIARPSSDAAGARRALATLHERHAEAVRKVAFAVLGPDYGHAADDIVQDVFLALAHGGTAAAAFRPSRGSVRAWLSGMARRAACQYEGSGMFVSLEDESARERDADDLIAEEETCFRVSTGDERSGEL